MSTIKKKQGSKLARQGEELALTPEFGPWDPHRAAVACTPRPTPHTHTIGKFINCGCF